MYRWNEQPCTTHSRDRAAVLSKHAAVAICLFSLVIALGGAASASVVVTLDCNVCMLAPNPGVVPVGETVEFACDANCGGGGCRFVDTFSGLTGVSPFDLVVPAGTSSPPLGPATVPDEFVLYSANQLPSDQDCGMGTSGALQTPPPPSVPGLADWGPLGPAALLVVASLYVVHVRRGSA
jgi:hypothetical protein